jgi:hypothetical protein
MAQQRGHRRNVAQAPVWPMISLYFSAYEGNLGEVSEYSP